MNPVQHKAGPQAIDIQNIECIVLAGGLGTRLRSVVSDLPKCMAPVAGKPFLSHLIDQLLNSGVTKFIFALGYMHEVIENFLENEYPGLSYKTVIENEPLGTGGAIQLACNKSEANVVLVVNGDTMFKCDLVELIQFHTQQNALCTLALKPMHNFDRYGVVDINKEGFIQAFREKQFYHKGLINGGVYIINRNKWLVLGFPDQFSFEKDFLEKYVQSEKMCGLVQDVYFIDIGIPEDFEKANLDFQ